MLSGCIGKSDAFDWAIADFSMAYAYQNEKDHAACVRAVRSGKVKAVFKNEKWHERAGSWQAASVRARAVRALLGAAGK